MALLITTCERDTIEFSDSNSTPQAETKGFVIKSVTINEVKENALIKESLDVIDSQFDFNKTIKSNPSKKQGKQTTSALADPIKSKDNRFTILTDEILEVSTDTTKVYTFRIETPTDTLSKFENFVIHKWSNNKIEYYIYKYNYLDKNQSFLRFTRERVNSDQINTGDFNDYTMGVMYYDPGSDCWISVTSSGGMTYIDASDCGVSAGSGGMSGSGGGAGNNKWYGQWAIVGVTWSNDCIISRAILDAYGNPTFTQNGSPRSQSAVVNCPEGGMNPLNPGQNQSNPWGNSTNPPNIDPLHWDPSNSGGGGGGGGGPSSSSTDGNNQEGTVIAVLPPTRLEREIESFFDNLTEEQKDCLSPGFGQPQNSLKKNITAYFKNNQAFQKFGFDSSTITPEAKAFAISTIDILSLPVITSNNKIDYAEEILRLTNHLKSFGNIEDEIYADYIQSLIPEFNSMTINEVRAIYDHVKSTCNDLTIKYLKEIITPIVTDLVIPVITYALFEATAGTAVKLLQKIPLPLVLRGARLNNLILKTTELGNPGFGNARLIPNSTVAKAEALFASLTKDAISVVPAANNPAITVAHMGNGMKIILRPISQTVPSAVRVIEYQNFNTLLGVDSFSLKFIP